jgi:hypothetical protein
VSLTASESVQIRQFRELRFCSGCRLWDSGVALSRWLCTRGEPDLLDKDVLELGSGVGMVGLVAARKARRVRLTDGEPRLLPNLRHNAAQAAKLVAQASARVDTAASAPTHRYPRLHHLTASFLPCAQLLLTRPGRRGGAQLELRSRRASSGARHLPRASRSRPGLLLGLRCGARPCGTRAAAPDRRHAAAVLTVGAARPAPIHGGAPLRQPRTRSQPRTKLVSRLTLAPQHPAALAGARGGRPSVLGGGARGGAPARRGVPGRGCRGGRSPVSASAGRVTARGYGA